MIKITWAGESRVLPGYGLAVFGAHILLPEKLAASFVAQGLAEPDSPPKAAKTLTQETEK